MIMRNVGVEDASIAVKIGGRNINNLQYTDDTTQLAERKKDLETLLGKVKEESERYGQYLNIKKT